MSIQSELTLLQNTKNDIRSAIMEKGVLVASNDPFAIYPTRIGQITTTPGDKDTLFRSLIERSATSLVIPNGTEKVRSDGFNNYQTLVSVTIPEGVVSIGKRAFQGCGLTVLELPNTVTSIGDYAFNNCSSLTSITCLATVPPTLEDYGHSFDNTNNCPIYVPTDSVDAYKTEWPQYASRIQAIPVSVSVFTKITSLDEATSGKYLIVKTTVNKALNASLIKDTTSGTTGINTTNNMIDVTIGNDTITADANIMNAAADYDADNKTLSWTDSDTGTTYYLYWQGSSSANFAFNGNTQPSTQYPMEAKYYQGFNSFSFANSTRLLAYHTSGPRIRFYVPNNTNRYEENMALFKLTQS